MSYPASFLERQFGLSGQTAVVFGAASGIGRQCAAYLLMAGAKVCFADIDHTRVEEATEEFQHDSHQAISVHADVSNVDDVSAAFRSAENELGPVSIVVNSVGIYPAVELEDQDIASWDRVQAVNLRGAFLTIREGVRAIRRSQGGGRIVIISSTSPYAPALPGLAAYAASKGGVDALVRAAALEHARDGITINAVAPGDTMTEGAAGASMISRAIPLIAHRIALRPVARMAEPDDIAQMVLALVAPSAGYLTGQIIAVDGGQSLT